MIDKLLPQAERIAARLKAARRDYQRRRVLDRGADLGGIAGDCRRLGLFHGRRGRLYPAIEDRAPRGNRTGTDRHHTFYRGLCVAVRAQDTRQARDNLVGRRDRNRRTDRQPLWPCRRPFLHCRDRPRRRALDHGRDWQQRPDRQHARVLRCRSGLAGEVSRVTGSLASDRSSTLGDLARAVNGDVADAGNRIASASYTSTSSSTKRWPLRS